MQSWHVVGAQPNFMKAVPVISSLIETQHGADACSHRSALRRQYVRSLFSNSSGCPNHLEVGSGSHAVQTAEVMVRLEKVLQERKPDWVVVYGDGIRPWRPR